MQKYNITMQKNYVFIKRYLLTSVFRNSKGINKDGIERQYIFRLSNL
ncbi:MAG: hypothetical protein ACJAUY_002669 [Cognaticolwellia sp.]|jgi:hypothetical protein